MWAVRFYGHHTVTLPTYVNCTITCISSITMHLHVQTLKSVTAIANRLITVTRKYLWHVDFFVSPPSSISVARNCVNVVLYSISILLYSSIYKSIPLWKCLLEYVGASINKNWFNYCNVTLNQNEPIRVFRTLRNTCKHTGFGRNDLERVKKNNSFYNIFHLIVIRKLLASSGKSNHNLKQILSLLQLVFQSGKKHFVFSHGQHYHFMVECKLNIPVSLCMWTF